MKSGVFALLDCLGFKGIWKRHTNPNEIIRKIESIADKNFTALVRSRMPHALGYPELIEPRVLVLSDTIVVSSLIDETSIVPKFVSVALVIGIVQEINRSFVLDDPSLLLRGCITFGEHVLSEKIIIGPAVDQAAEYEKLPNGAFIWLEPSVADYYREFREYEGRLPVVLPTPPDGPRIEPRDPYRSENWILDHHMPIKGGSFLPCSVLNPLAGLGCMDLADEVYEKYKKALESDRIDVMIKAGNTNNFLSNCSRTTVSYHTNRMTLTF